MKTNNPFLKFLDQVKSIFISGFLTLLPITLTFIIFRASFKIIAAWVEPIHHLQPRILREIPYSEFFFVILFILAVGIILKFFILKRVIHIIEESIFLKIPILRTLYSGIKQLIHAFSPQDPLSFKQVVMMEFPKIGIYSIGFLTGEFPKAVSPGQEEIYCNVFIPTTPNPTTGYFIIIPKSQLIEVDLTKQEAMALIISGGIIRPERFK